MKEYSGSRIFQMKYKVEHGNMWQVKRQQEATGSVA